MPNWYVVLFIDVVIPLKSVFNSKTGPVTEEPLIVTPYPASGVAVNGIILN